MHSGQPRSRCLAGPRGRPSRRGGLAAAGQALRAMEATGLALDVASLVGTHDLRELSAGDDDRPLAPAE